MIGWIFTIINLLLIAYYIKFTYIHYNNEETEKVKFPVWIIILLVIFCFIPILKYIVTIFLVVGVPLMIIVHNKDSYDEIKVKGFLNKKI